MLLFNICSDTNNKVLLCHEVSLAITSFLLPDSLFGEMPASCWASLSPALLTGRQDTGPHAAATVGPVRPVLVS